jgi:repressor LexA
MDPEMGPKPKLKPGVTRERVFEFVRSRLLAGEPPTVREVQEEMGFAAVQSAQQHLEALVGEGRLEKESGARGVRLPRMPDKPLLVPLLGRVQAGAPVLAGDNIEGYVPISAGGRSAGQLFALRVRGESMKLAGILEGDVVIVRRQAVAESGDVVVALLGDEATVKTLRLRGHRAELHPANPDFAPIILKPPRELVLLGKVIELRRDLDLPR